MAVAKHDSQGPKGQRPEVHVAQSCKLFFFFPSMKCPLGISNFLEEISSLSHSVVFLYFFALIAEEGFLISSCYSLANGGRQRNGDASERVLLKPLSLQSGWTSARTLPAGG